MMGKMNLLNRSKAAAIAEAVRRDIEDAHQMKAVHPGPGRAIAQRQHALNVHITLSLRT